MKDSPTVSIILPTYDRAELLPRAINSVLAQTHPDWELIIWDDGSTDTSAEVVRSYQDSRIKYFFDKNHGAAHARNQAVQHTRGKYLAFLDSDDEWVDEKLAIQVDILNIYSEIDVLFSDFVNIIEPAYEQPRTFAQYACALKLLELEPVDHNSFIINNGILESLAVENYIATDTVLIRKEVLEKSGPLNEGLRNLEDFEFWWRMGLAGVRFAYTDKIFLKRFVVSDGLSRSSILSCKNRLKGLDICVTETVSSGRSELARCLNKFYRITWQSLIPLYGETGDRKRMLGAFFESLKYGFSLGSLRLLFEAVLSFEISGRRIR